MVTTVRVRLGFMLALKSSQSVPSARFSISGSWTACARNPCWLGFQNVIPTWTSQIPVPRKVRTSSRKALSLQGIRENMYQVPLQAKEDMGAQLWLPV